MIFLQLFIVFLQIGIFGFGGGYSMISLIQGQVVTQYHWMTMKEFTDVVAIVSYYLGDSHVFPSV